MIVRTIALSALLFAGLITFGGAGATDLGITEDVSATCTHIDEVGCVENTACKPVAALIEKVTGQPTGCLE